MARYSTFEEAYISELRQTLESFHFRNSPRGQHSTERLGVEFEITHPIHRAVTIPERRANIIFNFAEALWYLSGSNSLEHIAYYAPRMRRYSADGVTLQGTAYGPRIFAFGPTNTNQWANVVNQLRRDPHSKRAVIQIFDGAEHEVADNIDMACTLALQFLVRDERVHMIAYMRANDAFRGVVSDVFSFTFLLEVMACELGYAVGSYRHVVGSYHVYDEDSAWAHEVAASSSGISGLAFPNMPAEDNWPHIRTVIHYEEQLRHNDLRLSAELLRQLNLPIYWRDILILLELQHYRANAEVPPDELLDEVDVFFKQFLKRNTDFV